MPPRSAWRARTRCRSWSSTSTRLVPSQPSCAARAALPGSSNSNKGPREAVMAQADVGKLKQDLTRRMDGALETLRREFNGLRTGRAHPGLLEPVKVHAYGTDTPLTQVGTV